MRSIFLVVIALACLGIRCPQVHAARSAHCAWEDRKVNASCPAGYGAGCVTEGDTCYCDCARNARDLAVILSLGDTKVESYIADNMQQILSDTKSHGYYSSDRHPNLAGKYPNLKISITPPPNATSQSW